METAALLRATSPADTTGMLFSRRKNPTAPGLDDIPADTVTVALQLRSGASHDDVASATASRIDHGDEGMRVLSRKKSTIIVDGPPKAVHRLVHDLHNRNALTPIGYASAHRLFEESER